MMAKQVLWVGLSVLLLLGQGCKSLLNIEKSQAHSAEARAITKVVSIDPDFVLVDARKGVDDFHLNSEEKEAYFSKSLVTNAKRAGIELVTVNAEDLTATDLDYFNYLTPLKRQIWIANALQDVTVRRARYGSNGRGWVWPFSREFQEVPVLGSEYSYLAEKYGTPYFAVHYMRSNVYKRLIPWGTLILVPPLGAGMVAKPNAHTGYVTIVVNVLTGEVVYREYRYINRAAMKDAVDAMVYDSFRILRKQGKRR